MNSTYNSTRSIGSFVDALTWPRNSIHSTNCTLFSNGVSPFLANLSLPTDRCPSLDSRHLSSRSRARPTVKEKFSLSPGYRRIDESLRESGGNWMTATRREVSIRWFNQLARDASLSLSPIPTLSFFFFCFWPANLIPDKRSQVGIMLHVFLLRKLSGGTIVRERIFSNKSFVIIFEEKEAIWNWIIFNKLFFSSFSRVNYFSSKHDLVFSSFLVSFHFYFSFLPSSFL